MPDMPETPETLMTFWTDEVTEPGWYKADGAIDALIRQRFGGVWQRVRATGKAAWPGDLFATILLCDQFARNMHRGQAEAFATDGLARSLARTGIARGADLTTAQPLRQFWYMPLTHSEDLADQDDAVALIAERLDGMETLLHARVHRAVIQRFGRFPFRNAALGRVDTAQEAAFLADGGYGALVRNMRDQGAANPQAAGQS